MAIHPIGTDKQFATLSGGGVSDGTLDPQAIIPWAKGFVRPVPTNNLGLAVEPGSTTIASYGSFQAPQLDHITRLMMWAEVDGLFTGWTYSLNMSRDAGANSVPVITDAKMESQSWSSDSVPMFTETVFGPDFMRSNGLTVNDILQYEWVVTPNNAVASSCWFFGMMIPAHAGANVAHGGRGHLFAPALHR